MSEVRVGDGEIPLLSSRAHEAQIQFRALDACMADLTGRDAVGSVIQCVLPAADAQTGDVDEEEGRSQCLPGAHALGRADRGSRDAVSSGAPTPATESVRTSRFDARSSSLLDRCIGAVRPNRPLPAPFLRIPSPQGSTVTKSLITPECGDGGRRERILTKAVDALFDEVLVLATYVLSRSLHLGTDARIAVDVPAGDRARNGDGDPAIQ